VGHNSERRRGRPREGSSRVARDLRDTYAGIKRAVSKGTKAPATKDETAQSDQQDKEFFSEDDQGPYYKIKNKEMGRLWKLAQNLCRIEEVREVYWETPSNPESIEVALRLEAEFRDKVRDSARPPLLDDIGQMLAAGNYGAAGSLVEALRASSEGVESLSKEKAVIVWVIVACDRIWESGRNTNSVTWGEVQDMAMGLFGADIARRKNRKLSSAEVKALTVGVMPGDRRGINWTRIKDRLGIALRPRPGGRPTKEVAEARERKFKKADIQVAYSK
jgi:hypothetical protein